MWRVNSLGKKKNPDTGKDWGQEDKGATEDEMVGWHHQLTGHECEQAPGDGEGQGSLVCHSTWGHKELDTTTWLYNNRIKQIFHILELLISLDYLRTLFISLVFSFITQIPCYYTCPESKSWVPIRELFETVHIHFQKPGSTFCLMIVLGSSMR